MSSLARKIAGGALALLYSLAVFFVFGEVATRAFGLLDRLTGFPRDLYLVVDDDEMPYRLRPNATVEAASHAVRVSSFGLRGAEVDAAPAPDTQRILVVGDSVVFGQGVGEKGTFPVQLQQELRSRGRQVEVLNGGVPGYNPAAELVFLREYGLRLQPRTVLVGVSLNDFGETPVISDTGILTQDRRRRADPDRWLPHSEFLLLIEWTAIYGVGGHWYQRGAAQTGEEELLAGAEKFIAQRHRRFYADPSGPGWQRARRSLREMGDLCAGRGIELWVMLFPDRYQRSDEDRLPQRRWLELCDEIDLRCVDLWPAFAAAEEELFVDVQHPNAAGHAAAARMMADVLTGGKLKEPQMNADER